MGIRVLLACKHVPYYGGDTTRCYLLFKHLGRQGYDVHYLNLVEHKRRDMLRAELGSQFLNPDSLPNVTSCYVESLDEEGSTAPKPALDRIQPDLIVGCNLTAPYLLGPHVRDTEVWFLPSSSYAKRRAARDARAATEQELRALAERSPGRLQARHEMEASVVRRADRVLCCSEFSQYWFRHFYPEYGHKLRDGTHSSAPLVERELAGTAGEASLFHQRAIDALFVAVNWSRREKNLEMLRAVTGRLRGRNVHVVGQCPEEFSGVTHHQLTSRGRVIELMKNAKAVASVSAFDAAPLVLAEAAVLGANVVASKNCGNYELCHADLLVDPYSADLFVEKIGRAIERRYESNLESFRPLDPVTQVGRLIDEKARV